MSEMPVVSDNSPKADSLPVWLVVLLRDHEVKMFRNGLGSITISATRDGQNSVCFFSTDGTRAVLPPAK